MPKPFLELTVEQFAHLVREFQWHRDITEVHLHHTYRPNHADFASRPPVQSIEGMFRYHTETLKWRDIAQHVTVDPDGRIWTGRNWNAAPASSTGFNGTATAGPFMIEMIGNFDTGNDTWQGAQRDAAIQVIALVQKRFGLSPLAFRFHHEMNPKSCPGTSLKKPDVEALVAAAHAALPAPRSPQAEASAAQLARLLNGDAAVRELAGGLEPGELPEREMTMRDIAIVSGDPADPLLTSREPDTSGLTPEQFTELRKYVVNLRMGAFSSGGIFQSSEEDVAAIFGEHLPAFLAKQKAAGRKARIVFFAHGGLNNEEGSLKNARNRHDYYLANNCYPIFFVWETGPGETLFDILGQITGIGPGRGLGETITEFTDPALEKAFRKVGFSMWLTMKRSAEIAFLPHQGGASVVAHLADFWRQHSADLEIHAIGHSAGAIFQAHFLKLLCEQPGAPIVSSLHFLAPAITVDLFTTTLKPLIGAAIKSLAQFTMHRDFELADSVGPYRKSLLYLVSRSFEDQPEMPILGLEESIRRDPDMIRFFGLLGKKPKGELIFSVRNDGPRFATIARKHGDFDNDRHTMDSIMRRILDLPNTATPVPFPESVDRGLPAPQQTAAAPPESVSSLTASPRPTTGRRRALCIGIDRYPSPNALQGCVNDSRAWAGWLSGLGFQVTLLTNEQATWQAMSEAIEALVRAAAPGDAIVLQYAGHGTLVDDLNGDENGGSDSALCPVDFNSGRFLIDDDLRQTFGRSLSDGINLTCFFDCCHSGTVTRLVAPPPTLRARGGDVRVRGLHATAKMLEAHARFRSTLPATAPAARGPLTMKEISFTACTDAQLAQEIDGHGVFTTRALEILRGGVAGFTNSSFHRQVRAAFPGGDQSPSLDCAPGAMDKPLLGGADTPAGPSNAGGDIDSRLAEIERRLGLLGV